MNDLFLNYENTMSETFPRSKINFRGSILNQINFHKSQIDFERKS